jgi:hypothetical protein
LREHRQSLHELRRERAGHRLALKVARSELDRVRSEHRRMVNGRTVFWGAHKDHAAHHKSALADSKKIARAGLDAHRRALAANSWILMLADMYTKLEKARKEREQARAERRAQKAAARAAARVVAVAERRIRPVPTEGSGTEEVAAL